MNTNYDVMVLGTGEAGIYAAYELALKCPSARVLVVDKGADIYRRQCPIVAGKVRTCVQCRVCGTMCGFGGGPSPTGNSTLPPPSAAGSPTFWTKRRSWTSSGMWTASM